MARQTHGSGRLRGSRGVPRGTGPHWGVSCSARHGFAAKQGHEIVRILGGVIGQFHAECGGESAHEVDLRHERMGDGAGFGEARPTDDEGHVVAAFVDVALEAPEGLGAPVTSSLVL